MLTLSVLRRIQGAGTKMEAGKLLGNYYNNIGKILMII